MKEVILKISKYILIFIILIGIYMILGTLTSIIPRNSIEKNVVESSERLYQDGEKIAHDLIYKQEFTFTFTDALMINTAYSIDTDMPLRSFLLDRKNYIPGQTKIEYIDSQYNLGASEKYINPKNGDLYQTKELYGLMHGEEITESFEYARYWHGYLVLLRPLLVFFNYDSIRIIQLVSTIILLSGLLFAIYKKINANAAIAVLLGFVLINIFTVSSSINESLVYIFSIIAGLILILRKEKIKDIYLYFFIIGSITNFIDLLTAPLVNLGIVGTIYFLILQKENDKITVKQYIEEILKICITWALGYGLTWFTKWIIVQTFLDRNLIMQALEQARYRMIIPSNSKINLKKVLSKNFKNLSTNSLIIISGLLVISIIYEIIVNKRKKQNIKQNIKDCTPYIFMVVLPFLWFIALKQHSYIHSFFTYRILIISIINIFLIVNKIFKPNVKDKRMETTNK